jgi:hypothetical protein
MKHRPITLIEVLQPRAFQSTPERARVTRTITQPEIDAFEQMEANATQGKSALGGRRTTKLAAQAAGN